MPKSAKKRSPAALKSTITAAKPLLHGANKQLSTKPAQPSKKSRVIAMLRLPKGATIDAMMTATGWQQHSVRGFLAGVVRKRLKLKLHSEMVDGTRVYRVAGTMNGEPEGRLAKRR